MLQAFAEGHRRGLLTVGLCGYDGGAMAASDDVDHCFVVRSESVHRIQEAQDGLVSDLWSVGPGAPRRRPGDRGFGMTDAMTGDGREAAVLDRIEAFRRRRPRLRDEVVTLAHGAGGKSSAALLDAVFLPAFANDELAAQTDAAVLKLPSGERLAFSTDSFVVKPLRFPSASVGHLAVHGTINDLAMMGARPLGLSAAFVLEEGLAIETLREIVADMADGRGRRGRADRHR